MIRHTELVIFPVTVFQVYISRPHNDLQRIDNDRKYVELIIMPNLQTSLMYAVVMNE
jgi:hypothetical protein